MSKETVSKNNISKIRLKELNGVVENFGEKGNSADLELMKKLANQNNKATADRIKQNNKARKNADKLRSICEKNMKTIINYLNSNRKSLATPDDYLQACGFSLEDDKYKKSYYIVARKFEEGTKHVLRSATQDNAYTKFFSAEFLFRLTLNYIARKDYQNTESAKNDLIRFAKYFDYFESKKQNGRRLFATNNHEKDIDTKGVSKETVSIFYKNVSYSNSSAITKAISRLYLAIIETNETKPLTLSRRIIHNGSNIDGDEIINIAVTNRYGTSFAAILGVTNKYLESRGQETINSNDLSYTSPTTNPSSNAPQSPQKDGSPQEKDEDIIATSAKTSSPPKPAATITHAASTKTDTSKQQQSSSTC